MIEGGARFCPKSRSGSFNFTKAAEQANAENLLVLRSKELAAEYIKNWQEHAAHSEDYVRPVAAGIEPQQ